MRVASMNSEMYPCKRTIAVSSSSSFSTLHGEVAGLLHLSILDPNSNFISSNPKGIASFSPGLASLRAYPGSDTNVLPNPERVASERHVLPGDQKIRSI
jgi:hypothetical protein